MNTIYYSWETSYTTYINDESSEGDCYQFSSALPIMCIIFISITLAVTNNLLYLLLLLAIPVIIWITCSCLLIPKTLQEVLEHKTTFSIAIKTCCSTFVGQFNNMNEVLNALDICGANCVIINNIRYQRYRYWHLYVTEAVIMCTE